MSDQPPNTPTDKEILEQIMSLISTEKGKQDFLRFLTRSKQENVRPVAWSKASVAPYYRKEFADWIKPSVDKVIENKGEVIFLYADFPRLGKNTLKLRVHQAFNYLHAEMDTEDKKYQTAREHILVTQESRGIQLTWRRYEDLQVGAKPVMFGGAETSKLKDEVEDFLRNGLTGKKFVRENLQLSSDEIKYFEDLVAGVISIRLIIEPTKIKMLKLSDEDIKLLEENQ